jgi:flagellar assembly factor FliW
MPTRTVETDRFGAIVVEESAVIYFINPILGFETVQHYVLLDHAENSPFKWLQAVEKPDLAFVMTNPRFFDIDYEFDISDEVVKLLGLDNADDALVLTMVNVPPESPWKMTTNLLGPIIIHQKSLKAMQVVLNDTQFSTKARLLVDDHTALSADKPSGNTNKVPLEQGD